MECDLEFQGLVIMENRLKDDTTKIIDNLMRANIRTIMVTGDNMLTALSVARDCEMITKGQSVITVNTRPHPVKEDEYELYYNLSGTVGRSNIAGNVGATGCTTAGNSVAQTPNGGDYALMTNSNSVASLETIDTFTHTQMDPEVGYSEKKMEQFDHDPLNLVPELPCNNYRFAMIGKTWTIIRDYFPELLPKFVTRGTVFARMSPDQKQALVLELQDLGYYVAMCGDGANDCGALKAAHTGISLSEAESSVASPFTSKNPTIACVPLVIKEGRAALVTSVGIFKYMAAYSLVQFLSVLILYSIDSNLTDIQFLYIDLFMISVFAFFFGKTESYDGPLVKETPLSSLVSLSPVASLLFHLMVAAGVQVAGFYHLQEQPWFKPYNYTSDDASLGCNENYTIFVLSCFQYIILAFIFSKGAPYRKSIVTNYGFLLTILVNLAISIYLTLEPAKFLADFFELILPESFTFRVYLVLYGLINLILALVIEVLIIDNLFFKKLRYRFHNIDKSRRKFLAIENHLRQHPSWPPLSLYQNYFANTPNEKELSGKTFAEILVESAIDSGQPFDQNSSVLNSFFETNTFETDATDVEQAMRGEVIRNQDTDETDAQKHNRNTTTVITNNNRPDVRNDSGIGFETASNNSPISLNGSNLNSSPFKIATAVLNSTSITPDKNKSNSVNAGSECNGYNDTNYATPTLELSNMSHNNNLSHS